MMIIFINIAHSGIFFKKTTPEIPVCVSLEQLCEAFFSDKKAALSGDR